jgi:hypothetical protein
MKKIRYKGLKLGTKDEWYYGSILTTEPSRDLKKMGTDEECYFYLLHEESNIILTVNTLFYIAHPEDEEDGYLTEKDSVIKVYADSVELIG